MGGDLAVDALAKLLSFRLRVGRLAGVDVSVHWTLLLAAVWVFVALRAEPRHAVLFVLVLLGSVLAHELGHCWGARAVGGSAREVVLWPLGGLADIETPRAPWPTFVATAAGPLVNVALLLLALPPYVGLGGGWSLAGPTGGGPPFLTMVVGVNGALALFNLIPAYPMDGGRLLQAALWPRLGRERAARVAIAAALVVSAGIGAWALVAGESLLFAVMAFVALSALAERERLRAGLGPDRLDALEARWRGDDADERAPRPGPIAAWRERRRLQRLEDEARARVAMRARLDEVLARVSAGGLASLTREERRFLEQASLMLRREQESGKP